MPNSPHELLGGKIPGNTGSESRWQNCFKLQDLPWLQEHCIQNQIIIPAATYCVMALEAARDISKGKQVENIELSDITIIRPIVINESSGEIETLLSVRSNLNFDNNGPDFIQAEFTLGERAAEDKDIKTVVTGRIHITLANTNNLNPAISSPSRPPRPAELIPVNISQFYDSLAEIGLGYGGPFRAVTSAERRMDFASAVVATISDKEVEWPTFPYPSWLEACFQTFFIAFAAPRDGSLWTAFTPTKIGRMALSLNPCIAPDIPASVLVDTQITGFTPGFQAQLPIIKGNMKIYHSETSQLEIVVEDFMMSPLLPATEKDDKLLCLKMDWQQDILSGVAFEQHHTFCYKQLGLSQAHKHIVSVTRQISHRYAKLRILQVGTSSADLVQAVCQELEHTLKLYMVVDASNRAIGGMEAQMSSDQLSVQFGVFDVERDIGALDETVDLTPFDLNSFDLVIILQTFKEKVAGLRVTRSLVKPGGFLLMMGGEDVPPNATNTTREKIHDILQSVGFSGVDSMALSSASETHPSSIILSQALDNRVGFLRAPLNSTPPISTSGKLLVLGGSSQVIVNFIKAIQAKLICVWDGEINVVESLSNLKNQDLDKVELVLSLTELDQSVLENLSAETFQGLHLLLERSELVLYVTHGARSKNPHHSGTIGLLRAFQAENPEKVVQLLDLDTIDGNEFLVIESILRLVAGVAMRDDGTKRLWSIEPELAVRGSKLFIPRVIVDKERNNRLNSLRRKVETRAFVEKKPVTLVRPIDSSHLLSPNKTYVLIGLSGHIGQSICRWMVKSGARCIVVTSRNPNKEAPWKDELQNQGAKIAIEAADVTNKQDMINLRNHILSTMPPIGGVANGAMVQSNCYFPDLTYNTLQEVLKPKVDGSLILDEVFCSTNLDFFLLFSSISAVTGQPFQANYAAANNFMTGLASRRRARNLAATVIDFGTIIGLGFIQRIDSSGGSEAMISILRSLDYMPISERDLHHLLAEAILMGKSDQSPAIITGLETLNAASNNDPFWHQNLLFSHVIKDVS
ncbi:Nonribosomal peptide synthetase 14 [Venustampulla echinocandica]|uniref:Nonribosomal peptide synthetase 14 n=1 Tax=Venustampulla echinocandica TaxID=2656787 RepID=A0A370TAT6_9HELO|nr:Nonribosomal peptide synthetase 14 [Venustampulla echinocandica]RDL31043.1 Nonribosomal peptide synthetase 14 [Venustampulla echinocandica]